MMFPIDYNGDVLNHNARVGVDGGIVESTDFLADFSEQTKRVNMPLLLDIYPNAAAAYSLRKLRTAYTGSAIRVRRSSDNTETDIGFNNAGDLDVSALTAFVGNNDGFVTTWYDQSGNNRSAISTGTTQQPVVVSGGTIISENNRPSLRFDGVNNFLRTNYQPNLGTTSNIKYSLTIVSRPLSAHQGRIWSSQSITSGLPVVHFRYENTFFRGFTRDSDLVGLTVSGGTFIQRQTNFTTIVDNNVSYLYVNKENITQSSVIFTGSLSLADPFEIGRLSSGVDWLHATLQEIIFYPSNQSPNRIGIETNINSYYRIYQQEALLLDYYPDAAAAYSLRKLRSGYTGAAIQVRRSSDSAVQNIGFDSNGGLDTTALTTFVGTGNTGFVTTWYDQSGNNRNATQTGTTAQPVIFSAGVVINENNKPSLRFNNSSKYYVDFSLTSPVSTWVVGKKYDNNIDFFTDGRTKNNSNSLVALDATTLRMYDTTGITHTITPYTWLNLNLIFGISNSSSSLVGLNNSFTTGTQPSVNMGGLTIGTAALNDNSMLNGSISEIIVYQLNQNSNILNINSNINSYYNIYPTDSDAIAFVTAAALTGTTQIQAVNKLVTDLKGYGLWGKMKAIYPFVGGTAASHKFNLKDPRDVDGAFRLQFFGGWTHSATGAKPDGSTGYADSFLTPATSLLLDNIHLSYYSRTSAQGPYVDIGVYQTIPVPQTIVDIDISYNGTFYTTIIGGNNINTANTATVGYFISTRTNSTTLKAYKNNSIFLSSTNSASATNLPNSKIFVGARSLNNAAQYYTPRECAFATIGDGLTDTEAANLYTAVQAFQTTLGRQV